RHDLRGGEPAPRRDLGAGRRRVLLAGVAARVLGARLGRALLGDLGAPRAPRHPLTAAALRRRPARPTCRRPGGARRRPARTGTAWRTRRPGPGWRSAPRRPAHASTPRPGPRTAR